MAGTAQAVTWELTVVYPSKEKKVFAVPKELFMIDLKKKSAFKIDCAVSPGKVEKSKYGPLTQRSIFCSAGNKGMFFSTATACYGGKSDLGTTSINLSFSGDDMYYFFLSCTN